MRKRIVSSCVSVLLFAALAGIATLFVTVSVAAQVTPTPSCTVSANPSTVTTGQGFTLTVTPSNFMVGTNFAYKWQQVSPTEHVFTNATTATFTHSGFSEIGVKTFRATVTKSGERAMCTVSVTVHPQTCDAGEVAVLTTTGLECQSVGSQLLTDTTTFSATTCPDGQFLSIKTTNGVKSVGCTSASGTQFSTVSDCDSGKYRIGFSGDSSVDCTPASVSCTVSAISVTAGTFVTWTATAHGFTPTGYSWSGSAKGIPASVNVASVTKRLTTPGSKTASVVVSRSGGSNITKSCLPPVSVN